MTSTDLSLPPCPCAPDSRVGAHARQLERLPNRPGGATFPVGRVAQVDIPYCTSFGSLPPTVPACTTGDTRSTAAEREARTIESSLDARRLPRPPRPGRRPTTEGWISSPPQCGSQIHRRQSPEQHERNWDYGKAGEKYPCWTVLNDEGFDTAVVYSEHGHGPGNPWGLVSLSDPWFGMDSGWFLRLEDAFVDSHMASSLPIWDLVSPDGTIVASSLSLDEAFARRDQVEKVPDKPTHHVLYRSRPPDGIP